MFEPEHTNAMASILNMIDKFNTFLLPEEEVSSQVLEMLKRKSPMEEIDSSDSDVCTIQKTYVTPCYTYDEEDTGVDEENEVISELTESNEDDWRNSRTGRCRSLRICICLDKRIDN